MFLTMRSFAFAVLLALFISPAPAAQVAVCNLDAIPLDKRAEPTISYTVAFLEQDQLRHKCGGDWAAPHDYLWGCAREAGEFWHIYIEKRLDDANRACVELHEKSHLPPNLWVHAGSFRLTPGSLFRRPVHVEAWEAWLSTLPVVKPITYD